MNTATGMIADTVTFVGHNGDNLVAYEAHPVGQGPFPGVVIIHHNPGWDEESHEIVRKFAHHGYYALCPNLYSRFGHDTDPASAAAAARDAGGLSDAQVTEDVRSAVNRLRNQGNSTGAVGLIGFCSGGRYAYLAACRMNVDAVVDCYGGSVVAGSDKLGSLRPVAPIDLTSQMSCPVLGIFGADDPHVPPEHVAAIRDALLQHGKQVTIYSYPYTGHAFLSPYKPNYKVESAVDAWRRILDFFADHLSAPARPVEVQR